MKTLTEQDLRRKISRLKTHFFSPKYEIHCIFIENEQEIKEGKLVEIKVDNIKKQFTLQFIEIPKEQ